MCLVFPIINLPTFVTHYIRSPSVVDIVSLFDDFMHPWAPIFSPHGYYRPYKKKVSLCEYHCPLHIYLRSLRKLHTKHQHYWYLWAPYSFEVKGLLFLCGIAALKGKGSSVPMGVDLICSEARFTLWLVSSHFWLCILWILYMLPCGHICGSDRIISWPILCSFACKTIWMYLMLGLCLHQKYVSWGVQSLQI